MRERTRSSSALRNSSSSRKVFTGKMPCPWTLILLYQAILPSAFGFKLPFMVQSIPKDHNATLQWKYHSSPWVNKFQWEEKVDKESPTLLRLIRDISEKIKGEVLKSPPDVEKVEPVKKSPTEKSSGAKYSSKVESFSKSPPEKSSDTKYSSKVDSFSKSPAEKSSDTKYSSKVESFSKSPPEKSSDTKYSSKAESFSKSPPEKSSDTKYSSKVESFSNSPLEKSSDAPLKVDMVPEAPTKMPSKVKIPLKDETVSKSLLEIPPDVTPKIILPSKVKTMDLLSEEALTTVSELGSTTVQEKLKAMTEARTTTGEDLIFVSTSASISTKSKSFFTNAKADTATTFGQSNLSSIPASTSDTLVENTSLVVPSPMPSDSPSKPPVTSANPTPIHDKTTQWISHSTGSSTSTAMVTHVPTEDNIHAQSLMKQCMLTILILAVVCTIFIITTIALAAKLSTMKHKQKLRHPATYTEMRCISSLLPENDQQSKLKPKRLKTFAATLEESDGDNTTLNSFLPDQ